MFNFAFAPTFKTTYKCYSVSMMPGQTRPDVAKGGKIVMPPTALAYLSEENFETQLNIQYPMLFKLTNSRLNRHSHAGVLEFIADEGRVYLPYWMLKNLVLNEGDTVDIEYISLPVARFAKFQAQSVDFLDITNQKAVLESALRSFACLTAGDMIEIKYNNKAYKLGVLETKPARAVSIIDCDMDVDFAPPVGYQAPQSSPTAAKNSQDMLVASSDPDSSTFAFVPFAGAGNRLDGKKKREEQGPAPQPSRNIKRGVPNYDYERGTLTFVRNFKFDDNTNGAKVKENFSPFSGQGQVLKKRRK